METIEFANLRQQQKWVWLHDGVQLYSLWTIDLRGFKVGMDEWNTT